MNIIIPMAGEGVRFKEAGYTEPKPLIRVLGVPMIQAAVESLDLEGNWIFIVRTEQEELCDLLHFIRPGCKVIQVDHLTEGPACTVLLARKFIDNNEPLITANVDQIMNWEGQLFQTFTSLMNFDGVVVTYTAYTKKNSYAGVDETGCITRIVEKEVISQYSLNGIHYWRHGSDFVRSADRMIAANRRTNGEFYIGPTYNELIHEGKTIVPYHIENNQHWAIGTPEDLKKYEDSQV